MLDLSNASAAITINGPGANLLSISGNNASGVFQVDTGRHGVALGLDHHGGLDDRVVVAACITTVAR